MSIVAEAVTFPADTVKTRLQIDTASGAARRGMISTAIGIIREERFRGLYAGLGPACLRHLLYSGSRVTIYEVIREDVLGRDLDGSFSLWKGIIAGMSAGAIGQFVASPADLLKVSLQTDGKRIARGLPRRFNGAVDAARQLYAENGVRGMWRGWLPNSQRAALVQLGDLTCYDYAKWSVIARTGWPDGPAVHAISSGIAGLCAAMMGTPADVIKTRVMCQPVDSTGRGILYSGAFDCLRKTIAKDGAASLYRGFLPSWLRMAPWSLTFFITFEQLRAAVGLSSF